jgi:hypothetical protein
MVNSREQSEKTKIIIDGFPKYWINIKVRERMKKYTRSSTLM